jgi:hypothetical protein
MNKECKRQIAVAILPWAGLRKDIQVGSVTFWRWDSSKVQDTEIKNQLEHFFKIFVDRHGKTANRVTICSHGKQDFRILDEKEYKELQAAINVLVFSSICPDVKLGVCSNNNSIAPPNAEYFDFFGQKFKIPDDNLVVIGTRSTASFEIIDKVHISMPLGVNFLSINPNEELLGAFNLLFNDNSNLELRERIFRSLEWFKFAHTEGNNVSDASRLVMMSTAFEILLDFPEQQKSIYFADQIENKLKKDKSIFETRTHKSKQYTYTKSAWWAYDFYQLRNKIVHGGQFTPKDGLYKDWINYCIVADLVFWELVIRELFKNGCLGERAKKWAEKFQPHVSDDGGLEEFFLNWTMGFDDYHRALGWVEGQVGSF